MSLIVLIVLPYVSFRRQSAMQFWAKSIFFFFIGVRKQIQNFTSIYLKILILPGVHPPILRKAVS